MKGITLNTALALGFSLLICFHSIHRVLANEEDSDTHKEDSDTHKEDSDTHKEDSDTHKEDSDTRKEDSDTHKEDSDNQQENHDTNSKEGAAEDTGVEHQELEDDDDACGFDPYGKDEPSGEPPCEPDTTPTHPEGDLGTAIGKCSSHGSMWRKICQGADAVNAHYNKITSTIDPVAKEKALAVQQSTSIHEECMESQEGTMSAECKTCTARLNPNKFGVIVTCYECQRGASDRTCHHVIKESPKLIVSTAFFEYLELSGDDKRNASLKL